MTTTTGLLRIYDPAECDPSGVPWDFHRCRACGGTGKARAREFSRIDTEDTSTYLMPADAGGALTEPCGSCRGYGSIVAAIVARVRKYQPLGVNWRGAACERTDYPVPDKAIRCEDCKHPAADGDGVWRHNYTNGLVASQRALATRVALEDLLGGRDVRPVPHGVEHWSPCGTGCEHRGPVRAVDGAAALPLDDEELDDLGGVAGAVKHGRATGQVVEARWRPVEVRVLGWPHDLRPEKLAVLCLHCHARRLAAAKQLPTPVGSTPAPANQKAVSVVDDGPVYCASPAAITAAAQAYPGNDAALLAEALIAVHHPQLGLDRSMCLRDLDLCVCRSCGHAQAEPNWCHVCKGRVLWPVWAKRAEDDWRRHALLDAAQMLEDKSLSSAAVAVERFADHQERERARTRADSPGGTSA